MARIRVPVVIGVVIVLLVGAVGCGTAGVAPVARHRTSVALPGQPAPACTHHHRGAPVTVMTRNLYLGGDIDRPANAAAGLAGPAGLLAFAHANDALRSIVDATDFRVRSQLIACEIAATGPDLVGLQEVALWRRGPLELDKVGVLDATTVDLDFLAILLRALRDDGLRYQVVRAQTESDVEGPAFRGSPFDGSITHASDVRLTIRDVILKRAADGLRVVASGGARYRARDTVDIGGMPYASIRGYVWADLRYGRRVLRFVDTHLESISSDTDLAQAKELARGPGSFNGTTIIVCDCNSDPLDHTVKAVDRLRTPRSAPYDFLTASGRFTDEWLQWAPADRGWTSGLSERVDDPSAAGFDHRIDMVFARSHTGAALGVSDGAVTGNQAADRDRSTGLWASDHAGVVLTLRLPSG